MHTEIEFAPEASKHRDSIEMEFVSMEDATTPSPGRHPEKNKWWVVCPDRGLLFLRYHPGYSRSYRRAQNHFEFSEAKAVQQVVWPMFKLVYMPVAYIELMG